MNHSGYGVASRRSFSIRGFSLIELLVVVTILAILMAIIVPSLISSAPERALASASERFGLDVKYAMQEAQATGNDVIMGFDYDLNVNNIENPKGSDGTDLLATLGNVLNNGQSLPPGNPGVARTASKYFIVEARKRWRDEVLVGLVSGQPSFKRSDEPSYLIPYTYLDWLNLYDAYAGGKVANPPVEPLFPFTSGIGDPKSGNFNKYAEPRYVYPLRTNVAAGNYYSLFLTGTPLWSNGAPADQVVKQFDVADRDEILRYDQSPVRKDSTGLRVAGPEDSPYLKQQIIDYVLLKEIKLPDHVMLMNPTKDSWVTDFTSNGVGQVPVYQEMQFLQHLYVFHPNGEIALADWGYDDNGAPTVYTHGQVLEKPEGAVPHCFWLTTDEVAQDLFDGKAAGGSPFQMRKAQQAMSGRMFVLWPLNGQYEVLDYAPNDYGKGSLAQKITDRSVSSIGDDEVVKKRELGYNQDFLSGQ